MTEFEALISSTLEAEANEVAMSVDTGRGAQQLEDRLDAVDRRRRWVWVGGAVAAAAALVVAISVGRGVIQEENSAPPVEPVETPVTYISEPTFPFPFTAKLPAWTASALEVPQPDSGVFLPWQQSNCSVIENIPCVQGQDLKLRVFAPEWLYRSQDGPRISAVPDHAGYVAYLHQTAADGHVVISDETTTTVGGRAATVMTLSEQATRNGAIGCNNAYLPARDCIGMFPGVTWRFAVVDQSPRVVLIWLRMDEDRPNPAEALASLDQILTTWRWES